MNSVVSCTRVGPDVFLTVNMDDGLLVDVKLRAEWIKDVGATADGMQFTVQFPNGISVPLRASPGLWAELKG